MSFKAVSALLCALLLLCSCSSAQPKPTSTSPVSVTVWTYYNGPHKVAFDQLVTEFNQTIGAEEGIVVEAFSQGTVIELSQKVLDAAAKRVGASALPDIFTSYADDLLPLAEQKLLLDLDTAIAPEQQALYVPEYLEEGRLAEGGLFLFPTAKSTEIVLLNQNDWEVFSQATGASLSSMATYEGILFTAQRYYEWTDAQTPELNDGKAFFGFDVPANYLLVGAAQLGHPLLVQGDDGAVSVSLDRATLRRLWDNFYLPHVNGWYTAQGRFRSDNAKVGLLLGYQGSCTSAAYFPEVVTRPDESTYPIEALAFPSPVFDGARAVVVQQGAGMAVVKSTSEREKAAARFLLWFSDGPHTVSFAAASGYLPVTREASLVESFLPTLEGMSGELSPTLVKSLPTALEQMNSREHYYPITFAQGSQLRQILTSSLSEAAQTAVLQIDEQLAAEPGLTRAEAAAAFLGDEVFDEWYTALDRAVRDTGATVLPIA